MKKIIYGFLILCTASIHGQVAGTLAERVYLQTDKQLYLAGELVYMKVFTVTPEKIPISFSKIVYVELLDEANSRAQVKIELHDGVGQGWMELPIDLNTGHYRLTAYTRFMRNEDETVFYEKNIGVINTFRPRQIKKDTENFSITASEIRDHPTFSLQSDKPLYANREKGMLKLDGLPENIHTISVSIAGKAPFTVEGTNDILQWEKQIPLASANPSRKYLPEYEGHIITGKAVSVQSSANPANQVLHPLLSFPGDKLYLFEGQNDDLNNVSFYTTNTAGIKEVATIAYALSENQFRIDLQTPFIEQHAKKQLPALRVDSAHLGGLLERSVALQALYSYTKDSLAKDRPVDPRFTMEPFQTYILDEWTRFIVMGELMIEFINELRFRRNDQQKRELFLVVQRGDYAAWTRPLVVLDGIPIIDHEIIYRYNPLLVERINIYNEEYIFQGMRFDGIVEFWTYDHNYPGLAADPSTQIVNYAGTQAPRRLYTPDYSNEENRKSRLPDYRHTLLWEPILQTKGKSTLEIPFYTSDYTGEFQATVEGLTKEGEIISATATFEVR
jgi:hypothetical protein